MNLVQDRIILASTIVVESIWFYAILAMFSSLMTLGESPLTWVAAVAVMGVSFIIARTLSMIIMPTLLPYFIQMIFGVIVIYLTLGSQLPTAGQGFDLGWLASLDSETLPPNYVGSIVVAGFFAALLWWRGGRLASEDFPTEHLTYTFRVGLMVLCLGAVVDIFNAADLKMFPLMFVFFSAGLVGLSIGHILPARGRALTQRAWTRVISIVVGGVMLVGLMFSLIQKGALSFIADPLGVALQGVAAVFIFIIVAPLAFIMEYLVLGFLNWLRGMTGEPQPVEVETGEGIQQMFQQMQEEAGRGEPSIWLQVVEWAIVAFVVMVVLFFMARAFRRRLRWRRVDEEGEREPISGELDPTMDMARLLFNLLPDRFRRRKTDTSLRLPDDDQDIVDVFRVYFGMLSIAESKGMPRRDDQTPTEYQSTLSRVFPERLVRMATTAFNRACYGRRPASREQITEMRQALDRSTDG